MAKNYSLELSFKLSLFFLLLIMVSHGALATLFHLGHSLLQCIELILHFFVVGVGIVRISEDFLDDPIEVKLVYLDSTRVI